jgi:hypothetical protein
VTCKTSIAATLLKDERDYFNTGVSKFRRALGLWSRINLGGGTRGKALPQIGSGSAYVVLIAAATYNHHNYSEPAIPTYYYYYYRAMLVKRDRCSW